MHLTIDYPWYFYLLCLVAGALFAALLYYIPFGQRRPQLPERVRLILAILRFLSVSLVSFLLLSPLVTHIRHEKEKPLVIIAQDNSRSISLTADSSFYRSDYLPSLNRLRSHLSRNYEVLSYSFGQSVSEPSAGDIKPSFSESQTDLAAVLNHISELYEGSNLGAVILASDGIYNHGLNPLTAARRIPCPIYTVALGDTTVLRDARISHVRCNREVSLSRKFPVEVTVVANRLKGQRASLSVSHDGKKIYSQEIDYSSDRFSSSISFLLLADRPGLQTYSISLSAADGEHSVSNNSFSLPVRVLDQRQHVALVAAAPHPDVAALRRALEANDGIDVSVLSPDEFLKQLNSNQTNNHPFDLAILHQIPSAGTAAIPPALQQLDIPALYILGSATDLDAFNALHTGVSINTSLRSSVDAVAAPNPSFASFSLDAALLDAVSQQPPLQAPFGNYDVSPSVQTLFFSRIGNITSDIPLFAVSSASSRSAFIFGEGIWRWRLHDLSKNGRSLFFDQLVSQLVRFVCSNSTSKRLRVSVPDIVRHDDHVLLSAELLDDNLEPTNTPDVKLSLKPLSQTDNPESKQSANPVEYLFSRRASSYRLDLGFLPEGRYSFHASTSLAGKNYSDDGIFIVSKSDIESASITADHALLRTISSETGALLAYPSQLDSIESWLLSRSDLKTVIHSHAVNHSLASLWWVLLVILLLFSAEWVIRKFHSEI
jgi:hypothetical protein